MIPTDVDTIFVIDHGLNKRSGHSLSLATELLHQTQALGIKLRVVGNQQCVFEEIAGIKVEKYLMRTPYDHVDSDPLTRVTAFDKARDELYAVLSQLHLTANDLVIFPTATAAVQAGAASYIQNSADPAACACLAMMPPGSYADASSGQHETYDPIGLLFTQIARQELSVNQSKMVWFATNEDHSRSYQNVLARAVPYLPLPLPTKTSSAQNNKSICLYLGDVRAAKGYWLLPDLVRKLAPRVSGWNITIQATPNQSDTKANAVMADLITLSQTYTNVALQSGYLDRENYEAFLAEQTILVLAYDPVVYAHQASGLLTEAIAAGIYLVVPDKTWLSREIESLGGVSATFSAQTDEDIINAVLKASKFSILSKRKAKAAAALYRRRLDHSPMIETLLSWRENQKLPGNLVTPHYGCKRKMLFDLSKAAIAGWHGDYDTVLWAKDLSALMAAQLSGAKTITWLSLGIAVAETDVTKQSLEITINGMTSWQGELSAGNHELMVDIPKPVSSNFYIQFSGYRLAKPKSGDERDLAIGIFHAFVS